jgi:hypothetical protein
MTTESSTDNASKLLGALQAMLAPDMSSTAVGIVNGAFKVNFTTTRAIDSNLALAAGASTIAGNIASTHTLSHSTPVQMTIESFYATSTAAITSANTNVATFALVYNNGNGGTDTTIASANTATTAGGGTGDFTAGVPLSISLTAANVTVPAGSCLQVKVTKSGATGKELSYMSFTAKARLGQ